MDAEPVIIAIPDSEPVSGLWIAPFDARAVLVLAHGAGAGMTHRAMAATAEGLAERGVATLRFQFPYMQKGGKRVDPPAVAQAARPLEGVRGLVFFAFPLHPAGKPSVERAAHLAAVTIPMLFLQGTKDLLAQRDLLETTVGGLGDRARLVLEADADHSFHVPAKSGRKDAEVLADILDAAAAWMAERA